MKRRPVHEATEVAHGITMFASQTERLLERYKRVSSYRHLRVCVCVCLKEQEYHRQTRRLTANWSWTLPSTSLSSM